MSSSINVKLITLFFLFQIIACKETVDNRHSLLSGKWFLHTAQVDGEVSNRLEGTVYEFSNGKITTNVPQIGSGAYTLLKDKLTQKGEQNIDYTIENLDEKSLVLSMTIRDIDFKLSFGRDSIPTTPQE